MHLITIGDNNVDTYASGYSYPGGNCPNVAAYAAMNGWNATYIGVLGNDDFGDLETRGLKGAGVNTSLIRRENGLTSRDVIVSDNGDRVFTCYDRSIIDAHPICFSEEELAVLKQADLLHSSVYSVFGPGEFDRLCALDVPVSYDFSVEWRSGVTQVADSDFDSVMGCLKENTMENICPKIDYAFFSCGDITVEETKAVLQKAVSLGCKLAVGTRGMEGSWLYDGQEFYHQQAYPAQVVDTLGAGDSFITRFLLSYTEKTKWLEETLRAVNHSIAKENLGDYLHKSITAALADAALFASRTCSMEGAFGFGEKLI